MSLCPLVEDAGLPGLRGCFPEVCMMEMFCFVVNKWSVERCLLLCVWPPSVTVGLGTYARELCMPRLSSLYNPLK